MTAFHKIDFGEVLRNKFPEKERPTYKFFNISISPQIKTHIATVPPPKGLEEVLACQARLRNLLNKEATEKPLPSLPPGSPSSSWKILEGLGRLAESTLSQLDYPSTLHSTVRSLIAAYVIYKVLRDQGIAIAASEKDDESLLSFSREGNLEINLDKMMKDLQAYRILDYVEFDVKCSPDAKGIARH